MLKYSVIVCLVVIIISCFSCGGNSNNNSPKFQQYYIQGEILYKENCSNCHQADGKGLGKLYPPLNQSDFMDDHFEEVICIIKYGRSGPLVVNGVEYNMEMKGNPQLTELEVAEIATFLYNSWSREKGLLEVRQVSEILAACD
jgi:cytochrome c551